MRAQRPATLAFLLVALALAACAPPPTRVDPPLKGPVRDSAYQALDRATAPAPGYGLYTVLLTRSASRQAVRVLTEVFATVPSAAEAALASENLNLVVLPVKDMAAAGNTLASARDAPDPTAATLLLKHYDYGQAALLLATLCRPERGAAVMRVCGSGGADGPLLVTSVRPLDPASPLLTQRLLVLNLSATPPAALGEAMAAYRRQIQRRDVGDRAEIDGWRLAVLNRTLEVASLLPFISKAYAGGP
jgi:hypothetical protein